MPGVETSTRLESILRRDRVFVVLGLLLTTGLAWLYLAQLAHPHGHGHSAWAPHSDSATVGTLIFFVGMWGVMMVAMMLPTAVPMILMYAGLARRRSADHGPTLSVTALVIGYLSAWVGFSAIAGPLDWGLQRSGWVSTDGQSQSLALSGGLLIAAGIFQWSALKTACLSRCRSPLGLLLTEWRDGFFGAWRMGFQHGLFCVGCCWALMGLMWVAGMLNLLWLAALTAYMLLEKVVPGGERWSKWTGGSLVAIGLLFWAAALGPDGLG